MISARLNVFAIVSRKAELLHSFQWRIILPSRFLEVFDNIQIDTSDRELLREAEVLRITAPSDYTALTVYIRAKQALPREAVLAVENAIRARIFDNKHIRVTVIDTAVHGNGGAYAAGSTGSRAYSGGGAGGTSGGQTGRDGGYGSAGGSGAAGGGSKMPLQKQGYRPGQSNFREAKNRWTPKMDKKSDNPDVIFGYDFSGEPLKINSLEIGMGDVIINGSIFSPEMVKTRNGKFIFKFNLTDHTDSISCRLFCDENASKQLEGEIKAGRYVSVSGTVNPPDNFNPDLTIGRIRGIKKAKDPTAGRMDQYPGDKRVELQIHTKMSDMDGIGDVTEYIKLAAAWGFEALAITDTSSVQAFPTAAHSIPKGSNLKLIFGCEANLVDDAKRTVINPRGQSIDGTFVVFDIETTGFSMEKNRIIEIGAVKIENGLIRERFSQFIDPETPIPQHIIKLTTITDADVRGQGTYEKWIPEFVKFCGDAPVVGHNATFDVGFIRHYAGLLGIDFNPTVVDTLGLSYCFLKNLFRNKLDTVAKELGVVLAGHHRAVNDAEATAGMFLKFCERMKKEGITNLDELLAYEVVDAPTIKKMHGNHFTLLAKNDLGRTNLYRLISAAHIDYFQQVPRMPKSLVNSLRDGLLIGSGDEESELYDALIRGVAEDELLKLVSFYDYLEILPPENLMYLVDDESSGLTSRADIVELNQKIIALGQKTGKPVCAVGNVHFPERSDAVYRKIIKYFELSSKGRHFDEARYGAPLYFRTTQEMLDEFRELGPELAKTVVIDNPRLLTKMCERIDPVRPDKCPPVIENSDQQLRDICNNKAHEMYGPQLPEEVSTRLNKELDSIISNGYSVMYIIAQRLVWDSNDHGFLVGSRGSVGSSLVATMAGISEVNPLPPHYRCPKCHYVDFHSETVKEYADKAGCDMPDAVCPVCGEPLIKDGFDIPFETFLGFKGDKEPDIDLNFAGDYQAKAHAYTEVIFGKGQTYKAGTIGTVQDKTAYGYVLRYNEDHEITGMRRAEIERLAMGCTEVRRTTGQHPGGIVVLPHGEEMSTFTPIQHPANDMQSPITTHFDYHSIDHNLLKLDILGKDDPSMVRQLQDMTGLDPMDIPVGVPEVMSLFQNTDSLGITPEDIGGTKCGTLGIPEFGTDFAIQMLLDAKPKYVSDLVRIAGLAHGTDVWVGNAQKLINEGKCTIQTAICTRDDIMIYLITKGLEPGDAFKIMELVRKGKFPKDGKHEQWCQMMRDHGVPDWYIWSCDTIKYMFPKAHAAAYVVMSSRIAYYKVHYPAAYYTAYFTVKGKGFDYEKMCVSLPKLRQNLRTLREYLANNRDASANDKLMLRDMRIAEEMMARGYEFTPIDIFQAKAREFRLMPDGKIMPSLNSIAGLGDNAADSIEADAKNGPYLSIEEFISRTKVTKTNAELLKSLGLLGTIPETNQLSIFDFA